MRISLFAGPGAGKSNLASKLYSELSARGHKIDLVQEYIKKWAYQGRVPEGFDQVKIFGEQIHAEELLLRKISHIVTDSPIPMQVAYAKRYGLPGYQALEILAKEFDKSYPSINILLDRTGIPYRSEGRYEDEAKAKWMDEQIELFLADYGASFYKFKTVEWPTIVQFLDSALQQDDSKIECLPPGKGAASV